MLIFLSMLALGVLLGFIGAGGAGVMIAVLTLIFDVPVHTALGISLGAMVFNTLIGVYSHFREGNVCWRLGLSLGLFGAAGAFMGAHISSAIEATRLSLLTGTVLLFFSALVCLRVFLPNCALFHLRCFQQEPQGGRFWSLAAITGIFNGMVAGVFGVGSAPLIQLTLLAIFNASVYHTVGTTMLVVFPIGLMGGLGYLIGGHLDATLFAQVVAGQMLGAYVGAKFTRMAPLLLLKLTMVIIPCMGGLSMLLFSK